MAMLRGGPAGAFVEVERLDLAGFEICAVETTPGSVCCRMRVVIENPFFEGHFPGKPVLPGVAQLLVVQRLLESSLGGRVRVHSFERVRFSASVHPGDELEVEVEAAGTDDGSFRITRNGELATRGRILWGVTD